MGEQKKVTVKTGRWTNFLMYKVQENVKEVEQIVELQK